MTTETLPEAGIRQYAADGAWCWFADPRAIRHQGEHDRTYFGWLTRLGAVQLGQYDHTTRELTFADIDYDGMRVDDHCNPAVIALPDNRLMVMWSGHALPDMYYRISTNPEDISAWGEVKEFPKNPDGLDRFCYPNLVWVPEESRLYVFWRGRAMRVGMSWTDDLGATWEPAHWIVANPGQRPYSKFAYDGHGGIHFATTDGHPGEVDGNNVYYARIRDGKLWHAANIEIGPISETRRPSDLDMVHNAAEIGYEGWTHDVASDAAGNPVVVLAGFPNYLTEHRYRYAAYTELDGWTNRLIVSAGPAFETSGREPMYSGGVSLDHANPATVYLSRKIGERFEIEEWRTHDQGEHFAHDAITENSTANNVRPIAVRNAPAGAAGVLWMNGAYTHYTDYKTGISGYADGNETRTVTRLRSSLTPTRVSAGGFVNVSARLVRDDDGNAFISGEPVQVFARILHTEEWKFLANGTTDINGLVSFSRRPSGSADYELRYPGSNCHTPAIAPRVRVEVVA